MDVARNVVARRVRFDPDDAACVDRIGWAYDD